MERHSRKAKVDTTEVPRWDPVDDEERELQSMIENGEIDLPSEAQRKRNVKRFYARASTPRPAVKVPVTMRMEKLTLLVLKDRARREGLRYQTLISSILHKYIMGQIVERKEMVRKRPQKKK